MRTITLEKGLATFLNALTGKNRSAATIRAYATDISQFISFLHANNVSIHTPAEVEKIDVMEFLSALAKRELTGIARARKMSAIREYFRFLEGVGVITKSPTTGIETPKREKNSRQFLRSDEYTKMLSLAGANPRDYAVLQVFLQTGIRVSELANLRIADIDFIKPSITVRGKGSVEREIALEKKGIHALKSYLAIRPESISTRVFLNYQGEPISERGIRKLVVKYRKEAGITKKASCHTLRHTFATYKAEKGVSAYQLQQWLGHANLNTTQIYVHLGKQNARKIMQDTNLMRYRYNRGYRYRLTNPPKALFKARLDNIAIVPASMLGLKALWQTAANTLPQGGVLLCHSQQNTRQKKLLERVGETFRQHGHAVMNLSVEQVAYR